MRRTSLLSIVAVFVVLNLCGCSKNATVGGGGAGATLKDDPDFVRDVALKSMAEIDLSRMALSKAASGDVKAFAQMMVDDHGPAENALKTIVAGQGIEWPAQGDEKHKKTAEELATKQGLEFDREYMKAMVAGHQDLAAKLESRLDVQSVADWKTAAAARAQSTAMPDPKASMGDVAVRPAASADGMTMKINTWAAERYPIVQKHLDSARTLENAAKERSTN